MKKDLFINIFEYTDARYPFQIFIGGRGTGKTYSAYRGVLGLGAHKIEGKFIWMRRTDKELHLMDDKKTGEGIGDIKKINKDFGTNYGFLPINDNLSGVYNRECTSDGRYEYIGAPIGYGVALSTISSIRGMNFDDCSDWIYDEFIPEMHVKKIKEEGDALLNAYETINRNREFQGRPPINLWMLANSNNIYNEIFKTLGLVSEAEKMVNKGLPDKYFPERGLALHILPPSEAFKEQKANTALYRLTKGTKFYDMALENSFAYNDFSLIGYRSVTGYVPMVAIDGAYIYRKKGDSEIYVSYAPARVPSFNSKHKQEAMRFRREYGVRLHPYFISGKIVFESYELKSIVLDAIL